MMHHEQGFTNPGCWDTMATKFYTVAPHMCGSSVWNFLHVIHLVPRIFRWLLDFWKILHLRSWLSVKDLTRQALCSCSVCLIFGFGYRISKNGVGPWVCTIRDTLLFQGDDSLSNSIVVHCGDDSNSAEGLNVGEERPLPPVSSSPITAKVMPLLI
jgi:hypothetical protein